MTHTGTKLAIDCGTKHKRYFPRSNLISYPRLESILVERCWRSVKNLDVCFADYTMMGELFDGLAWFSPSTLASCRTRDRVREHKITCIEPKEMAVRLSSIKSVARWTNPMIWHVPQAILHRRGQIINNIKTGAALSCCKRYRICRLQTHRNYGSSLCRGSRPRF